MLATPQTTEPTERDLVDRAVVYEPKYDGIRALVTVEPGASTPRIAIYSRNGHDKTAQFPDIVRDLKLFARELDRPVLLDGEIVALDAHGEPTRFERLQGRMHLTGASTIDQRMRQQPAAFIAFDLLRDGGDDLRNLPLTSRRAHLERLLATTASTHMRLGESTAGDGRRLYQRAIDHEWEGLISKRADSTYETGRRSPTWRKLKILRRQEFVIGGWTEPRQTRAHFGALLLGLWVDQETEKGGKSLIYVGSVGTGFDGAELTRVDKALRERATTIPPFANPPRLRETAHWVRPELVCEVKFTEWTSDLKLRQPVYLGLRDDKPAREVVDETSTLRTSSSSTRTTPDSALDDPALADVIKQLDTLEDARRDGTLTLPGGGRLDVTNLSKLFWPGLKLTKGDLLRYYVRVSPWLLPVVADRPLVMKRFPNGIKGKAFYQQRAPDEAPPGARIEVTEGEGEDGMERMPRLVGGDLKTLLYTTQLAAISQDPWFSRVQSPEQADWAAIDLDPMPGVSFAEVLEVARIVRDELEHLEIPAVAKTSGSKGLHIYIPLPAGSSYGTGQLLCQIVATFVASKHPKLATVERSVRKRGRQVYVDYLQNIQGKTLATAYSARASEFAGVSTPLRWNELDEDIRPEDFTITTVEQRFRDVGDLWAYLRTAKPPDLRAVLSVMERRS
jgi:bifunctional non-homologous end joining protein LigD